MIIGFEINIGISIHPATICVMVHWEKLGYSLLEMMIIDLTDIITCWLVVKNLFLHWPIVKIDTTEREREAGKDRRTEASLMLTVLNHLKACRINCSTTRSRIGIYGCTLHISSLAILSSILYRTRHSECVTDKRLTFHHLSSPPPPLMLTDVRFGVGINNNAIYTGWYRGWNGLKVWLANIQRHRRPII